MSDHGTNSNPVLHRALIFQGGGSLGAYEAGAFNAINEQMQIRLKAIDKAHEPVFHLVAGTSIGAINAAILVSYVKENKTWHGSAERIIEFWKYISTNSQIDSIQPVFNYYWDTLHKLDQRVASGESARRYYGTKEFIIRGVPNVFKPKSPLPDSKFFDPANTWYIYDNTPLKESLEKFAKFPIATSFDNNEPRLLLVAADVQKGSPVLFDSYEKENGRRRSEYGRYGTVKSDQDLAKGSSDEKSYEHIISYDDGITSDFVLASCSVPINYDYTRLEVEDQQLITDGEKAQILDPFSDRNPNRKDVGIKSKNLHYFWDGGLLANTPLRQAVIAHRNFWNKVRKMEQVPGLRVGIVNLHPIEQDSIPNDYDGVVDRKNDIIYHDRTEFDEFVAGMFSGYQELAEALISLAARNGASNDSIQEILNKKSKAVTYLTHEPFTYRDLITAVVNVDYVIRLERRNDTSTIANKTFDFSKSTINKLIDDGYRECREQLIRAFKNA
jgi:predicted acylesterase/phospholipase RssA